MILEFSKSRRRGLRNIRISSEKRDSEAVEHKDFVVPIVVGASGTVTNNLGKHLKTIGVTATVELLQKATLLGTARILRKVLEA